MNRIRASTAQKLKQAEIYQIVIINDNIIFKKLIARWLVFSSQNCGLEASTTKRNSSWSANRENSGKGHRRPCRAPFGQLLRTQNKKHYIINSLNIACLQCPLLGRSFWHPDTVSSRVHANFVPLHSCVIN